MLHSIFRARLVHFYRCRANYCCTQPHILLFFFPNRNDNESNKNKWNRTITVKKKKWKTHTRKRTQNDKWIKPWFYYNQHGIKCFAWSHRQMHTNNKVICKISVIYTQTHEYEYEKKNENNNCEMLVKPSTTMTIKTNKLAKNEKIRFLFTIENISDCIYRNVVYVFTPKSIGNLFSFFFACFFLFCVSFFSMGEKETEKRT